MYGRGANEKLVGKAIGDRRDEVVLATKFGNVRNDDGSREVRGDAEYVRQACDASLAAARRRPHRPLLPAPRRLPRPDRGDGRRDGGARRSGQGSLPRALRGLARDDPPRARRAPDLGAPVRVLALDARPRGRAARRRAASSGSASSPTARSAAASSPARFGRRTTSRRATSAATSRASRARTSSGTSTSWRASRRSQRRRDGRRGRSRSRGSCRAATTSSRSRERSGAATSRRTPRRRTSSSPSEELERLEQAFPQGAAAGERYPDMSSIDR